MVAVATRGPPGPRATTPAPRDKRATGRGGASQGARAPPRARARRSRKPRRPGAAWTGAAGSSPPAPAAPAARSAPAARRRSSSVGAGGHLPRAERRSLHLAGPKRLAGCKIKSAEQISAAGDRSSGRSGLLRGPVRDSHTDRRTFIKRGLMTGGSVALAGSGAPRPRTPPARAPVSAHGASRRQPPNILVIVVDQLRNPALLPPTLALESIMPNLAALRLPRSTSNATTRPPTTARPRGARS